MLLGCRQASGRRLGSSQSCTAATCTSEGAAGCPSDGGFPAQQYFEIDMCSIDAPPMGAVGQNTSSGVRNHAIRVAASQRASSVCVSFARSSQTLLRSRSLIVPSQLVSRQRAAWTSAPTRAVGRPRRMAIQQTHAARFGHGTGITTSHRMSQTHLYIVRSSHLTVDGSGCG